MQEVWNRGNNLAATAIATLAGIAFLPETFIEDHPAYKIDDGLLFLIGIAAFGWYVYGQNKFKKSVVPMIFVTISLLVKIMGFVIEMKDADDVGMI